MTFIIRNFHHDIGPLLCTQCRSAMDLSEIYVNNPNDVERSLMAIRPHDGDAGGAAMTVCDGKGHDPKPEEEGRFCLLLLSCGHCRPPLDHYLDIRRGADGKTIFQWEVVPHRSISNVLRAPSSSS